MDREKLLALAEKWRKRAQNPVPIAGAAGDGAEIEEIPLVTPEAAMKQVLLWCAGELELLLLSDEYERRNHDDNH